MTVHLFSLHVRDMADGDEFSFPLMVRDEDWAYDIFGRTLNDMKLSEDDPPTWAVMASILKHRPYADMTNEEAMVVCQNEAASRMGRFSKVEL